MNARSVNARSVPSALIVILLLAFGAVGAACGGGGERLTLEEYFQQVETLTTRVDQRESGPVEEFQRFETAESDEEAAETARIFFGAMSSVFSEFARDLDGLNPPSEFEDAHDEAVEAGEAAASAFRDAADRVEGSESRGELIGELLADGAVQRFTDTCLVLQDIADENEIEAFLNCAT